MAQETMGQWFPSRICRRVASSYKLNSLQGDPSLIRGSVEPTMLHKLPQEWDHPLCSILIHVRQIDFITEQNQPFAQLKNKNTNECSVILVNSIVIPFWPAHKNVKLEVLYVESRCSRIKSWIKNWIRNCNQRQLHWVQGVKNFAPHVENIRTTF